MQSADIRENIYLPNKEHEEFSPYSFKNDTFGQFGLISSHDWKNSNTFARDGCHIIYWKSITYSLHRNSSNSLCSTVLSQTLPSLILPSYLYHSCLHSSLCMWMHSLYLPFHLYRSFLNSMPLYRGADTSLARSTSRCILFDGENISFDANPVIYIYIYI